MSNIVIMWAIYLTSFHYLLHSIIQARVMYYSYSCSNYLPRE